MMTDDLASILASDAAASGPTESIDTLVTDLIRTDLFIQSMEDDLKTMKERRNKLQMELLPNAMMEARKKKLVFDDGAVLSLRDYISAGLPGLAKIEEEHDDEKKAELLERRTAGLAWLRANNGSAIIKNELTVEIPKGNDNVVTQLIDLAEELGLAWQRAENVHHMTLQSFLKEKVKSGAQVPEKPFALVLGQKAHYKPGKKED